MSPPYDRPAADRRTPGGGEGAPGLQERLRLLERGADGDRSLKEEFAGVDRSARRLQALFRLVAIGAIGAGSSALVLAVVQLSFEWSPVAGRTLQGWEVGLALVTLLAVIVGMGGDFHRRWLLERHRSERLRLLQFRFLVDPDLASEPSLPAGIVARGAGGGNGMEGDGGAADAGGAGGGQASDERLVRRLRQAVERLRELDRDGMKQWAGECEIASAGAVAGSVDEEVTGHYVRHRLDDQIRYFRGRSERFGLWDAATRALPAPAFFVGVAVALVHGARHLELWGLARPSTTTAHWMVMLAISLPIGSATLRLFRDAFEFARNKQRFDATAAALGQMRGYLQAATDGRARFRALLRAEEILREEHREWLRLMLHVEWYG